jgi:hypothetical protein
MKRGDRWKISLLRRADILAQVILQCKITMVIYTTT